MTKLRANRQNLSSKSMLIWSSLRYKNCQVLCIFATTDVARLGLSSIRPANSVRCQRAMRISFYRFDQIKTASVRSEEKHACNRTSITDDYQESNEAHLTTEPRLNQIRLRSHICSCLHMWYDTVVRHLTRPVPGPLRICFPTWYVLLGVLCTRCPWLGAFRPTRWQCFEVSISVS